MSDPAAEPQAWASTGTFTDQTWQAMAHFVIDHRGAWKKAVTERTGLAFNTIRLLRRIGEQPRPLGELAEAIGVDSPAASVAVSQLESAGLATRRVDPANRRRKIVELTADGVQMLRLALNTEDPAPGAFAVLDPAEVAELHRLMTKLEGA